MCSPCYLDSLFATETSVLVPALGVNLPPHLISGVMILLVLGAEMHCQECLDVAVWLVLNLRNAE